MPDHAATPVHEVRFRRPDGREIDLEVLRVEAVLGRRLPIDLSDPQRVHFHEIILVERGRSTHDVDFEPYPVAEGSLVVVRAGQTQAFAPERVIQGPVVVFTPALLASLPDVMGRLGAATRAVMWQGPTVALAPTSLQTAVQGLKAMDELSAGRAHPFLNEALAAACAAWIFTLAGLPEVIDRYRAEEQADPLVTRFFAHLEAHFRAEREVGFYARKLHVSTRTLDRHVHAATGRTTKRVIIDRTVLEARRLLTQRDLQVKAVADALGYLEPQNFSRFFRTQTGESPEAFRARLAGAE